MGRTRTESLRRPPPGSSMLLGQALVATFQELGLFASLLDGDTWLPLYIPLMSQNPELTADVVIFEHVHGVARRRAAHNRRAAERARHEGRPVLTEHAGFHDLFAPVPDGSRIPRLLVAGPLSLTRPTAADVRTRWRWLTGKSARLSDPELARYLATTLATVTFSAAELEAFRRLVECFARGLAEAGDAVALLAEARRRMAELSTVRYAERMWSMARRIVDEGVWRAWKGDQASAFHPMGAKRLPEHIAVGLLIGQDPGVDPIEDVLRRVSFQRACVDLAREAGGTLAGRVGDHGVALLLEGASTPARTTARIASLTAKASALSGRYGLRVHWGISAPTRPFDLPARYQAALAAAEAALSQGVERQYVADGRPEVTGSALTVARRQLTLAVTENAALLAPRFERYVEAVGVHSGYQVEPMRAHLEAGLDRVIDALSSAGVMDRRSATELERELAHASERAANATELSSAFRKSVVDLARTLEGPKLARQDRGVRRAIEHIRDHFDETLSLGRAARIAGFAPSYFSRLFAASERMTFREYVQRLRVERAKQMLTSTTLRSERVGQLCGFRSRQRFHAIFTRLTRVTPSEYRRRASLSSTYRYRSRAQP